MSIASCAIAIVINANIVIAMCVNSFADCPMMIIMAGIMNSLYAVCDGYFCHCYCSHYISVIVVVIAVVVVISLSACILFIY